MGTNTKVIGTQKGEPKRQYYDLDTINTVKIDFDNGNGLYGRENIVINVGVDEFRANPYQVIKDNLGHILSIHKKNCTEMEYLKNFHKGKQDILDKVRANNDTKINNKHVSNYAWEFVSFKKGYYIGKPIKYVDLNTEENSQMRYLSRYMRDVKKSSKDLTKYENMLITGIAHTMVQPVKTTINNEYQSPYTYTILDNKDVCVVKSSDIYKTKLFSMCISRMVEDDGTGYYVYTVYYDDNSIQLKHKDNDLEIISQRKEPISNCITEYQFNEQRMGVFEPVIIALNSLNKMTSDQLDQLEESINAYLTFENVDISSILENIDDFRRKRILAVNTTDPNAPAKIGSVKVDVEQTSVNNKYNDLKQETYDIVAVPMPTSSTGQGVSGEAQVYGGGWENAQTIASVDTQYIMQYEQEDLYKFIEVSNNLPNSKLNNLIPTDIEVKYTINKSNNMMVKAQSLKYFVDNGFTREQALMFCEITDDPQNEGKIADENADLQKQKVIELELEKMKKEKELEKQYSNETENKEVIEK